MRSDRRTFLAEVGALGLGAAGPSSQSRAEPPDTAVHECGSVPFSYVRGEPMRIGNDLQLLADDYIVEDRWML
jgi:hypothetical protein